MTRKNIAPITDEEEARIQAAIASDPDNPEPPFAEAFPALARSIKRLRGRPRAEDPKEAITLRLSSKTIERYKAIGGHKWRSLMVKKLEAP